MSEHQHRRPARDERGLSLIEVILALGLMGAVMISIAGMFVISERGVESGKTSSESLAVARAILEEINSLGFQQTYQVFGFDGTAATYTLASDTNAYAAKWQTILDDTVGRGAVATIEISSVGLMGNAPSVLENARAIEVTVTIDWTELERPRDVTVSMVRM